MHSAEISTLLIRLSAWYLPAMYIATVFASTRLAMPQARAEWTRNGFVFIVIQFVFLMLSSPRAAGCVTICMATWAAWFLGQSARKRKRLQRSWILRDEGKAGEDAPGIKSLALYPPFRGTWRAVTGGSDPARNHHFAAPPQWFAYDFVRTDGKTLGSDIVAPCAGIVVGFQNGIVDRKKQRWFPKRDGTHPAGNFVLIEVDGHVDVYVVLAHLQKGSVLVTTGDRVECGQLLGHCGNSGNTTAPHLHLHAQFVPPEKLNAKGKSEPMQWKARGVPLRLLQEGRPVGVALRHDICGDTERLAT
jgi:hypothetical protein